MKSNRTLLGFVVVLMGLVALLLFRSGQPVAPTPTPAVPTAQTASPDILTIQDGQTIDFSSGKPVITSTPDGADLQADLDAMKAASAGIIFSGEDLPPAPAEPPTTPGTSPSVP